MYMVCRDTQKKKHWKRFTAVRWPLQCWNYSKKQNKNLWPLLQFWLKLSCRIKSTCSHTDIGTHDLFLGELTRKLRNGKKKSLGTISAQQRYSQSQRIHIAQIHQFKYVLHGEREYSFISHLNLDKKKTKTHVLLSWCINGKLVWKLSLQKKKVHVKRSSCWRSGVESPTRISQWSAVIKPWSGQAVVLVPPDLPKHAIRPSLKALLGIHAVFCLFITVLPPHVLVQHISFSSQTWKTETVEFLHCIIATEHNLS